LAVLGALASGGCGSKAGAEGNGTAVDGTKSLVQAPPRALSAAERAAQEKALAESKRRAEAARVRVSMEIEPWARGKVLNSVPVKKSDKVYALTFDDGPWPESTRQILSILKANNVKATFYMVGQEVTRRPELAREVVAAGHAIGNHSWDHPSRPRDPIMQVQRTNAAIKKAVGFAPTSFRPPYGIVAKMAREAQREGDPVLIWTADSTDWKRPGSERIARNILNGAHPGGIALMHDGGGNREQTVAALPTIIAGLKARGYTLVTIPELIRHHYVAPPKPKATAKPTKKPAQP
jgi:peptidoglycan/xylan/chitin deacetylase (PgdA/CDA1 family)